VSNAITVNIVNGSGTATGTIRNNKIGVSGVAGSGSSTGSGIAIGASVNVVHTVTIDNNTVIEIKGFSGIDITANVDVNFNATITNNNIALSFHGTNNFSIAALYALLGGMGTETGTVNLDIRGNVLTASGAPSAANAVIMDQISTFANYNLPGYTGSPNGEFAASPGTASVNIDTYLLSRGNTMFNGPFPSFPGGVDAGLVIGVTGIGPF
jgi:hypothetical protein